MTQYARYFLAGVFLILALPGIALANDDTTTLELDKAEASLQAYLVENPDLPLPRLALARVYFLQGKDTLAREHFERVLASDPPAPGCCQYQPPSTSHKGKAEMVGEYRLCHCPRYQH